MRRELLTGEEYPPVPLLGANGSNSDCVMYNIMMDADAMYPEGFHPVRVDYKPDYSGWAPVISRSVAGVRYYFVDFGISVHIPEDDRPRFVTGNMGRDRDPPELSATVAYDPFKLDVFIIGNMLAGEICDVCVFTSPHFSANLTVSQQFSNLDFLRPLTTRMANKDPEQRPTAEDALRQWSEIRESISTAQKEWRPRPRDESALDTVTLDVVSLYRLFMHVARVCVERVTR